MLYFAYGSNLDWDQMRERCPSASFVTLAKLKDHCLGFTRESTERECGVADVVQSKGDEVWGAVYNIDEMDVSELDKHEGYQPDRRSGSNSYNRKETHVYSDKEPEEPLLVCVYFAVKQKKPPLPSDEYKGFIVRAAKHWNLPAAYVRKLENIKTGG